MSEIAHNWYFFILEQTFWSLLAYRASLKGGYSVSKLVGLYAEWLVCGEAFIRDFTRYFKQRTKEKILFYVNAMRALHRP